MRILILMLLGTLFMACTREPMKDKAADMFRKPSSEEQGKIPDKFQPIDHEIDTAPEEQKNSP